MIKMLVLDIDGTIYKKDFTASQRVKDTIKTLVKKGVKVVLATGRMYAATLHIAKELELDTPIICYQGGLIKEFKNSEKTIFEKTVPPKLAKEIIKILKEKNIFFNLYLNDILIVEKDSETIRKYTDERKIEYRIIENIEESELEGTNKILAIDSDEKKIENLTKELAQKYRDRLYIIRSTPTFCEISNIEATKGNAVRHLANLWKIKENEIMAVGDQDNDIEMLNAAGVKVAMGNGTEGLKKIADYITDTVDNDGVCTAIEKYCLGKEN